jgi:DNA-directed RNA polymerase subunit E'/Rpb7
MAQMSLYYPTQLETSVSLLPEQLDGNIDNHILSNLKAKVEGKATENGIELRVNRLIDYNYGMIDKANFMGTTVYKVKYECFLCSPIKDLEIVCIVDNIVKGFLIGRNGPVVVAIQFNNIDTQKFDLSGNQVIHKKTKKPIKKGDYLKTSVININNNLGEKNIVTMCKLIDFANKDDIKKFEEDQMFIVSGSTEESQKEFI